MNNGFITPIQLMQPMGGIQGTQSAQKVTGDAGADLFKGIFQNAIDNVNNTDKELTQKQYQLATGQLDDGHTVSIAAAQAQLSVDLLVQLRNKTLESYNQIMSINV